MKNAWRIVLVGLIPALWTNQAHPAGPLQGEVLLAQHAPIPEQDAAEHASYILPPRCPDSEIVGFTIKGKHHISDRNGASPFFDRPSRNQEVNTSPSLIGQFTAPCTGLYSFTVSFVKDAYANNGTTDDVYMHILHYEQVTGKTKVVGEAMSGEGTGKRGTGTATIVLYMVRGDQVYPTVSSDAGATRHLIIFSFTGYLIKAD
ncbi:MAG: hypothetical protein JXB05_23295 [Myxococcaceae bacterium]|nr:hypothetical protein [Myxococcaceae bacterium]